jgi:hypothetical protein
VLGIAHQPRQIVPGLRDQLTPFDQELLEQLVHQGLR